jgi:Acyl-CoA hydrolase
LAWLDEIAGLLAARYSGGVAVTGSVDETAFYAPIRVGDIVTVRAGISYVGKSSMEILLDVLPRAPMGRLDMCVRHTTRTSMSTIRVNQRLFLSTCLVMIMRGSYSWRVKQGGALGMKSLPKLRKMGDQ